MKIKTEIFKSIFIITCEGNELNPTPVGIFLTSMKSLIQKKKLDILIDLSAVKNVEGGKLGTVARSLVKAEDSEFLIVCGVSERVFNLLRMTRLDRELTHTTNRNEALSLLYWERKRTVGKNGSDRVESFEALEEAVKKSAAESFGLKEHEENLGEVKHEENRVEENRVEENRVEENLSEAEQAEDQTYVIDIGDLEFVSIEVDESEGGHLPGSEKQEEKDEIPIPHSHKIQERRRYKRVKSCQVTYDDVIVFCKNTVTGKHYTALILDFSLGGLLMRLSPPNASKGDELLVEGRIGRQFKFKEKVTCHSRRKDDFAFEFKGLSTEAKRSMGQMIDALN